MVCLCFGHVVRFRPVSFLVVGVNNVGAGFMGGMVSLKVANRKMHNIAADREHTHGCVRGLTFNRHT